MRCTARVDLCETACSNIRKNTSEIRSGEKDGIFLHPFPLQPIASPPQRSSSNRSDFRNLKKTFLGIFSSCCHGLILFFGTRFGSFLKKPSVRGRGLRLNANSEQKEVRGGNLCNLHLQVPEQIMQEMVQQC